MRRRFFILIFCFLGLKAAIANDTKVWDITTLETIIAWHKVEYDMFEAFMINEDTIQLVDIDYKHKSLNFKVVDSTLFNRLKDLKISRAFLALDMFEAAMTLQDLLKYASSTLTMVYQLPRVSSCEKVAIETQFMIAGRFSRLVRVVIQKAILANEENLANNKSRDDLTKYVLEELRNMRQCSVDTYNILKAAKLAAFKDVDLRSFSSSKD